MSELNRDVIIKALKLHSNKSMPCAEECPYSAMRYCGSEMAKDALSLINELTEENERLTSNLVEQSAENVMLIGENKRLRADTVREMQERFSMILKKEYEENTPEGASFYFKNGSHMMWSIADRVFAQIAKEMVEGKG